MADAKRGIWPSAARALGLAVLLSSSLWGAAPAAQAPSPDLATLLDRAATYIEAFQKEFFGAVAEEHYDQSVRSQPVVARATQSQQRRFLSEVAILEFPNVGWVGFRDVIEVDGRKVVDRADRLTRLLQSTGGDLLKQGLALADEGSRFNLGTIGRNLNHPSLALIFLTRDWWARSRFTLDGDARVNGGRMFIVRFTEHASPSTVRGGDTGHDVYASGRFWIDPATGRVGRSELRLRIDHTTAVLTTTYASRAKFTVWVPTALAEVYDGGGGEVIEGRATYTNFRAFTVDTTTIIKD